MRYGLLDLAACQYCGAPLTSFTARERESKMPQAMLPNASRVASGPHTVGPSADNGTTTALGALLRRYASPAADPARNFAVEIEDGLLICAECGRWYPIGGLLPEILPDHLRNRERDLALFRAVEASLPSDLREALSSFVPGASSATDAGAHFKTAEMSIREKADHPDFFGPGYTVPFNPWDPEFSFYLITLFGIASGLLAPRKGETIVDSGCGYAWTSEWFHRSGLQTVGVDITRIYLEIGIARMGPSRPHLLVGDVENLPLRASCADGVFAYESFHHIPDRPRAIACYDRVLRKGGRVVLAEPDEAHETSEVAVEAMRKYGILERGMSTADVRRYVSRTTLKRVQRLSIPSIGHDLRRRPLGGIGGNLFVIRRPVSVVERITDVVKRRDEYWTKLKRRVKLSFPTKGLGDL